MTEFDLTVYVCKIMDETDIASPHDIAAKVARTLPDEQLREALSQALPQFVRVLCGRSRLGTNHGRLNPTGHSAKVAGIRDAAPRWRRALRDRIHVETGWKLLGQCTYDDLRFAAAERRHMAAANLAVATRQERLAAALKEHAVDVVADLPDDVLAAELDGEPDEAAS